MKAPTRFLPVFSATALLIYLFAAGLFSLALSRHWSMGVDAPLMHYVAWRISEGDVPYRDIFDMNFPGSYLAHLLVQQALGFDDVSWRLFDLVTLLAISALLFFYCRPFGVIAALGAALLFSVYHLGGGPEDLGQRDYLLAGLILGAAFGVAKFLEGSSGRAILALAGFALGLAATIKPQVVILIPLLAGVAGWRRKESSRVAWGGLLTVVAATGVAPLTIGAWLWASGGLVPLWDLAINFLPLYAKLDAGWMSRALNQRTVQLFLALALLALWVSWRTRAFDVRRGLLCLGMIYGALHFISMGKGYPYHLYPLVLFSVPLATSFLGQPLRKETRIPQTLLLCGLLVVGARLGLKAANVTDDTPSVQGRNALLLDLADKLSPSDKVQLFDSDPAGGLYAFERLRIGLPTRFIYDFQFFVQAGHPYIETLRKEFILSLKHRPPKMLVVFRNSWPQLEFGRFASFPELEEWITSNFSLERETPFAGDANSYRVYVRNW